MAAVVRFGRSLNSGAHAPLLNCDHTPHCCLGDGQDQIPEPTIVRHGCGGITPGWSLLPGQGETGRTLPSTGAGLTTLCRSPVDCMHAS